ncbi:MAG: ABC transporter permease [Actinobacteria bacterium]|nr:ABC transporter permease [Actinomycetota bacterium]
MDHGLVVALVAAFVFFSVASPFFLSTRNFLIIGQSVSVIGILAAALTIGLIAGVLDLSVGSTIGVVSVVAALLAEAGASVVVVVGAAVSVGLAVGGLNTFLIVKLGIDSIIATLATASVFFGTGLILAQGKTIYAADEYLGSFVSARPLGIPTPVILLALTYVAGYVLLAKAKLGWHIYATGGNRSAADRSGIPTKRILAFVLLLSALAATVGGLILAGRTLSGSGLYGRFLNIDALTAVLLGGIGLSGGRGKIEQTLVGVLFIGILANGLTLLNTPSFYQAVVRGFAFLLAIMLDAHRRRSMER